MFIANMVKAILAPQERHVYELKRLSNFDEGPSVQSRNSELGTRNFKLAAGEGVEPPASGSKPDVLPVTPSRNDTDKETRKWGDAVKVSRLSASCCPQFG